MKDCIDRNKLRVLREARERLAELLDYGTEEDFVVAVKTWKPGVTPDELKDWIRRFHSARSEKRGLSR